MANAGPLVFNALQKFAGDVCAKLKALAAGNPEDQLRGPLETFLADAGKAIGRKVLAKGETRLPGRLGRPDYAVLVDKLLAGYVELKEPGKGANPSHYKGHDREQWKRYQSLPNLLYTDGNEWALYRNGNRVGQLVRLTGDISRSGKSAVKAGDSSALVPLLTDFLSWEPIVPKDAKALADLLAPLCRMLRQEVNDSLRDSNSPLVQLAKDWRNLLFPDADDDRFADAYAQTVTFALLLARSEGAQTLDEDLHESIQKLAADHALLSRALQVLTDQAVRDEIAPSLRLLQRVINHVPPTALARTNQYDPWLYFYEDFLAAYDPKLRKDAGAYYTPVQVVNAQVRLIDRLLVSRLSKPMGFGEPSVITLDPGVGTGTYLLSVIDHALKRIGNQLGPGAVPGSATQLGKNIFGFEIMVGPYAVAQLRVSRALMDRGASLPKDGPSVYLTDTLESPHAQPPQVGLFYQPLADQHERALRVKDNVPVLVCLGNPPYDRHAAAVADQSASRAKTGGWVRWGDSGDGTGAVFRDFLQPAIDAGHGVDLKNIYNLYVYFWRWALWKVFEHTSTVGPGVVSFISASSYIDGDAFVGMREHMRRLCDEVWVIDLGGEGRGTRKEENVFAIQTPVAIAIGVRYGMSRNDIPAKVHYSRIEGTREKKLARLDKAANLADLTWRPCPDEWHAPFRPIGKSAYFYWPLLIDLMPWQQSGVQVKRTWPIAPDVGTLKRRWQALLDAKDRAGLFKETRDRKITATYPPLLPSQQHQAAIAKLAKDTPTPDVYRYGYRSFDRQWLLADSRLGDFIRPVLWRTRGEHQVFVTTLLNHPLGFGPALTACAEVPDLHHFRGSFGAREVIPLYRDAEAKHPNVLPGLLDLLQTTYGKKVSSEDFLAYLYGILAQPSFVRRFHDELETRQLRVPLTQDVNLFDQVAEVGRRLLWLHTYGQRFAGSGQPKGEVPQAGARCTKPVSDKPDGYPKSSAYDPKTKRLTLDNGVFEPVESTVWEFEVSGLKVVQSWLAYRMASGKGRKSTDLDSIRPDRWTAQFTKEFLELLWVLEATLSIYPQQGQLLDKVLAGLLFKASELPVAPDAARKAPPEHSDVLLRL